jgi:phenylacetate-CoA ligase
MWEEIGCWDPAIELMPRKGLIALQGKKLAAQVKHVYTCSPFHRKKLDKVGVKSGDIKSSEDIRKLPLITRDELRKEVEITGEWHGGRLCVPEEDLIMYIGPQETPIVGESLITSITGSDQRHVVNQLIREWRMIGVEPRDRVLVQCWDHEPLNYAYCSKVFCTKYVGPSVDHYLQCLVLPLAILPAVMTERTVHTARYFKPKFMFTNLEAVEAMKKFAEDQKLPLEELGYQVIVLREYKVLPTAEKREELHKTWDAEIYSMLDIQDNFFYTTDCSEHNGLHVWEDAFVVEAINPETKEPVPDGEQGKLVITNLVNKAMPIIRYLTDVDVILNREVCSCGRTHIRLKTPGY